MEDMIEWATGSEGRSLRRYEKREDSLAFTIGIHYVGIAVDGGSICQRRCGNGSMLYTVLRCESDIFCCYRSICGKKRAVSVAASRIFSGIVLDWFMDIF